MEPTIRHCATCREPIPAGQSACGACETPTVELGSASHEMPELPGYRVIGALGRGGMGTVYLAEDVVLGRKVAIKVAIAAGTDEEARSRFLREARSLATVEHPNVVRVHAFGDRDGGQQYLVMEH